MAELLGEELVIVHEVVNECGYGRFSMWGEDAPESLGDGGKVSFIAGRNREGPAGYFYIDILSYLKSVIFRVAFNKEDCREHGCLDYDFRDFEVKSL